MGLLGGKRALVTGSRKGIGRAIALRLAEEGANVGLNDVLVDTVVVKTRQLVSDLGRKATVHPGDMSLVPEVFRVVDEFVAMHGGIDILVNNAVTPQQMKPLFETDEAFWDQLMSVTLKGYFFASQRAAKAMVKQKAGGSIICLSSVHAFGARPEWTAYGTAKAGVSRMVKGLAADLAGTGIRANCIAPGTIRNVLPDNLDDVDPPPVDRKAKSIRDVPSRIGGLPSDIANAVVYLCSDLGRYVNGETLVVDGGLEATRMEGNP
ncbi:MAG: SDR family NAD(P)-dependent oxidoreductase [Dehalococcoidia bacterium]